MGLQTIVALAVVALCAVYVAKTFLRTFLEPESAGCHCSHCPSAQGDSCSSSQPADTRRPRATPREA